MKSVNLDLVIEKEEKPVIWASSKTINIVRHINAYITVDNVKIKMDLDSLIDVIKKFGYEKDFETRMREIFVELDEELKNYEHKDGKIIADPMKMYCSDVNISYYNEGYFSIVISRESARGNLLKAWEDSFEKIKINKA